MEQCRAEKAYLDRMNAMEHGTYKANEKSVIEGFEYLASKEYLNKDGAIKPTIINKIKSTKGLEKFRMIGIMGKHIKTVFGSMKQSFKDVEHYVEALEQDNEIKSDNELMSSYPNNELWQQIKKEAWERWGLIIGFTHVPREIIFQRKSILFEQVIVCLQEMEREKIEQAPSTIAGGEVIRVYKTLGVAVNEMAEWLRETYHINCQSNHPLGGLVDTCPLAAQAGLGFQGSNGLLITPEFGQRQRIAPIFIQEKLFEYKDSDEHKWGEQFCKKCGKCRRACPGEAIYEEKKVRATNVGTIGDLRQCIDREKCFPHFNKTMGCGVCMKTCPFSKGEGIYEKIRKTFQH